MAVQTSNSEVPARVRVLLADDHVIFRDGLKLLLQAHLPELEIVAEAEELTALKSLVQNLEPALLMLDYHMPGGDTAALLGYFRQRYPDMRIVMLTGAQSPLVLRQLVDLGADAVLLKQGSGEELLASLRKVLAGGRVLTEAVRERIEQTSLTLTPRELQVMKLIYDGLSNSEIAQSLSLSPKTVDKHRENLMRKMECNNVTQLVKKVYALKLLETESPPP